MRRSALYSRSPRRDAAGQGRAGARCRDAGRRARRLPPCRAPLALRVRATPRALARARRGPVDRRDRHRACGRSQRPSARPLTQKDIDGAVLHTLATQTLPSRAAKAYEAVRPSVVKVIGTGYPDDAKDDAKKDDAKPDDRRPSKAAKAVEGREGAEGRVEGRRQARRRASPRRRPRSPTRRRATARRCPRATRRSARAWASAPAS